MQNRDAQAAIAVHVGVVDGWRETEGGRSIGELGRETHLALEVPAVVHGILVENHEADVPQKYVIVVKFYVESGEALFWVSEVSVLPLKNKLCGFGTHDASFSVTNIKGRWLDVTLGCAPLKM